MTQIKRIPGQWRQRNTNRDVQRDVVMRKVFAEPGLAAKIARHLGIKHQNLSAWRKVPAHHVLEVAPFVNMTPESIRPDVFKRRRR